MVGVLRRYSRQPHVERTAKRLARLLDPATAPVRKTGNAPLRRVHRVSQRLSAETVAALVADYRAGVSSTELQAKYSLSKGSVLRLLGDSGVEMRRRGLTDSQLEAVLARYRAGLTIREVAAELELPKTSVQNALERSGLPMRPAARRTRST